jgi:ribosome biogenesis GTPase
LTDILNDLGWGPTFLRQLDIDEISTAVPARVTAVHRDRVEVLGRDGPETLPLPPGLTTGDSAVGDWLLIDRAMARVGRVLERKSLIHRRAAGVEAHDQLIAANIDTLFITSSMNADFNPARLERYLALAYAAEVTPVIVLTRADLCDDPAPYENALRALAPSVVALMLDARDPGAAARLRPWCGPGQTVAFVGSSGVGKSTLIAALTGDTVTTRDIREDDAKGRHTTTARSFHRLAGGGWLIDTPGMRALRLAGVEAGIDAVFADIDALAELCRFSDCRHEQEPGCAVQAAIATGELDPTRLTRWQKLKREDARNSESIAEAHRRNRSFGKMVKQAMTEKRR